MQIIRTGVWEVRVRTSYNFDNLCKKFFFSEVKKDQFVKQIKENLTGVEIFEEFRLCEDCIEYEE